MTDLGSRGPGRRRGQLGLDETYTVKHNDTVAIAEGHHPLCGAPGYAMYYLWTMCGASNRGLISSKDPAHGWVQ